MAQIINGKAIAADIGRELAARCSELIDSGIHPCLAVIEVGESPASRVYLNNKRRACEAYSVKLQEYILPETASVDELSALILELNACDEVHGIMLELPLPRHINAAKVLGLISPDKDVDGACFANVGKLLLGEASFLPCTPAGVVELLKRSSIELAGKSCVILGRSNVVGKPLAMLLLSEDATVTICHTRTLGLANITRNADIIITSIGKPRFLKASMVKPGATVIDVGINRDESGRLCGDADFQALADICAYITPVPGGVGPMTVTMLIRNVLTSAERTLSKDG